MELKKFMIIDMLIFTIIAILSEWIGSKINRDFIYISFAQIFLLMLLIRWNGWGVIPIILVSLFRPLIHNYQGFKEFILYSVPILSLTLALIPIKLGKLKNVNKRRHEGLIFFSSFYLLFVLTNGLLIKTLINNQYSIINDFPKYLLMLIIGNIIYYLLAGQKTMLINILENQETNEKDRENNGHN